VPFRNNRQSGQKVLATFSIVLGKTHIHVRFSRNREVEITLISRQDTTTPRQGCVLTIATTRPPLTVRLFARRQDRKTELTNLGWTIKDYHEPLLVFRVLGTCPVHRLPGLLKESSGLFAVRAVRVEFEIRFQVFHNRRRIVLPLVNSGQ